MLAALGGMAGCERAAPFDPDRQARTVLQECAADSTCVRERWRREPQDWNLGLRAEVAGREPRSPLVVETTREIVSPDLRRSPCAPEATAVGTVVYFQTAVGRKGSDTFPFALFRWKRFEDALIGHRLVVVATAKARGDEGALWDDIQDTAALDRACSRFVGHRDLCQPRD
jgi:hypothetical protein